jgi:hypothetical protein
VQRTRQQPLLRTEYHARQNNAIPVTTIAPAIEHESHIAKGIVTALGTSAPKTISVECRVWRRLLSTSGSFHVSFYAEGGIEGWLILVGVVSLGGF